MDFKDSFGRAARLIVRSLHFLLIAVLSLLSLGIAGTWLVLKLQLGLPVDWKGGKTFGRVSLEGYVWEPGNCCDAVVTIDRDWGHSVWTASVANTGRSRKYSDCVHLFGIFSYPLNVKVPTVRWQWCTFAFSSKLLEKSHRPCVDLILGVSLPFWFLILLTGTYPGLSVVRGPIRRWRRRRRGLCVGCGYDLQGNVSGVCSECGRETTKAPRHKAES